MDLRETYPEAAERFMGRYAWQIYSTPTWRQPISFHRARHDVSEFFSHFGKPAFAYVAYERGRLGGRIHAHLLLGGLSGSIALGSGYKLWRHGQIEWEPYKRRGGAARYVWKDAKDAPETGGFIGTTPRRLYPRKRGRRGRGKKGKSVA